MTVEIIERDGYDRDAFARKLREDAQLRACTERVARLLPAAEAFVAEVFCLVFKMNVRLAHTSDLPPSALLPRRLLAAAVMSPGLAELKRTTELDADASARVVPVLADRMLRALTRGTRSLKSWPMTSPWPSTTKFRER